MVNRHIGWVDSISDELGMQGPTLFTRERLHQQEGLFAHRSALFYTPTENIPAYNIGADALDVTLPVVTPDYTCVQQIRAYSSPRLWVDLLQQQSGKLRWSPISPARLELVRYDYYVIRLDHAISGSKALIDALKVGTFGRRDGKYIYYFGAILDEGPDFIDLIVRQTLVEHPRDARVRVTVSPLPR